MVVVVDGRRHSRGVFTFAANLARHVGIGSIRCLITDSHARPSLHVLLPSGAGEQMLMAGGCSAAAFDGSDPSPDAGPFPKSITEQVQHAANAHGLDFAGSELFGRSLKWTGGYSCIETLALIPWQRYSDRTSAITRLLSRLPALGISRLLFYPLPAAFIQRVVVETGPSPLSEVQRWAHDWARCLNASVHTLLSEREPTFCRTRGLADLLDWLGCSRASETRACAPAASEFGLKPTDLHITSMSADSWSDGIFPAQLAETLNETQCAIGIVCTNSQGTGAELLVRR